MAVDRINVLSNASATGSVVTVPVCGYYQFGVTGTFGGATVKLQILSGDNSTYIDVASSSLTAAGTALVALPAGISLKGTITGGPPSAVYATLDLAGK